MTDKIHTERSLVHPCTSELYKEFCSSFTKSSSSVDTVKKPLPLPRQLMHKEPAMYLSKNEAITSEHQATIDMSRSLPDITDCDQFQHITCSYPNSVSNVSTVHKDHSLQVPLTTCTAMTKEFHDVKVKPLHLTSASFPCTRVEDDYDDIYNVASPKLHIISKG